jgi:hypothetical protein
MDISSSGDPSSWNYKLRQSSAAINFGQTTGINKDFYDQYVPFGNAPDAGIAENISGGLLPLQILSCKGWSNTNGNNIVWETTNDVVNNFEVERSNDGNTFTTIASVPYKTTAGSATITYQFVDEEVTAPVQYYRIKANEPGSAVYSQIVTIKNDLQSNKMTVWPNPARADLYLKIAGGDFRNKEMLLVNMSGIEVCRAKINDAGTQVKLSVAALPQGAYIIKITDPRTGRYYKSIFVK